MQNFINQISGLFSFKYLIYWVEILVILAIVLLVVYVSFALNLFKRNT
jgi:hypothetical protein